MEKQGIRNLKVFAIGLCLSSTLLVGCNSSNNENEIKFGSSIINSENENLTGTINYNDLSNYCKIVTIEQDNVTSHRLYIKKERCSSNLRGPKYNITSYIDLKTGVTIIESIEHSNSDINYIVGENLTIVEEKEITSYLLEHEFIKQEYELNEVIEFFEETIKPTLSSNEKEMVK